MHGLPVRLKKAAAQENWPSTKTSTYRVIPATGGGGGTDLKQAFKAPENLLNVAPKGGSIGAAFLHIARL